MSTYIAKRLILLYSDSRYFIEHSLRSRIQWEIIYHIRILAYFYIQSVNNIREQSLRGSIYAKYFVIFLHLNDLYLFFLFYFFYVWFFFIMISSFLLLFSFIFFFLSLFFNLLLSWYFIFTTNIDRKRKQQNRRWHKKKKEDTWEAK